MLTIQQSLMFMLLGLLISWMIICSYMALRRDAKVQVAYQETAQNPAPAQPLVNPARAEGPSTSNEKAALPV